MKVFSIKDQLSELNKLVEKIEDCQLQADIEYKLRDISDGIDQLCDAKDKLEKAVDIIQDLTY